MFVLGKIESGSCRVGDRCVLLPNRTRVEISNIFYEDEETDYSISGENVRLKLKHLDDDSQEISVGSVLCRVGEVPCQVGRMFEAQIALIDVKNLISIGFSAILHLHSVAVEVRLEGIVCLIDRKTGKRLDEKNPPRFLRQDQLSIVRLEVSSSGQSICLETFDRLSCFTLRDESRTLALGKVLRILE